MASSLYAPRDAKLIMYESAERSISVIAILIHVKAVPSLCCRITRKNCIIGIPALHKAHRCNKCGFTKKTTPKNNASRGDPCSIRNDYWRSHQGHILSVSMASRGDEGLLRHHYVMPDPDEVLVMDPDPFTYPTAVSYLELPGELDSGSGSKSNSVAYLGPKSTQEFDSNTRADLQWICNEEKLNQCPKNDVR